MITNESTARARMGIDTTVTVTFRCLNENDPEYLRPNVRETLNNCPFERREKSIALIYKDSPLCSE